MTETSDSRMRQEDWTDLVQSIQAGKCILMLGPDAVTEMVDGDRVPVMWLLARELKRTLDGDDRLLDDANFSAVAQAVRRAHGKEMLTEWTAKYLGEKEHESELLADIARMPFDFVINTAPGIAVEQFFTGTKGQCEVSFYDRSGNTIRSVPDGTVERPLVYNLFGSIDVPGSLVLSETDLLEFLVNVIAQEPELPRNVLSTLRDPERFFLFLGFRLQQWPLRILLHALAKTTWRGERSFAFEALEGVDRETQQFYQKSHRIHFFDMDVSQFVRELKDRLGGETSDETAVARADATVFICHAHEDAEKAAWLAAELRDKGIKTWIDQRDLGGGDQWDPAIERAIGSEVDYVIVIHSQNLVAKTDSYVNKEIALALERASYRRKPRIFVIPVQVDDAPFLEDLGDIDFVDLRSADGVRAIVQAVRRDIERDKKRQA